MDAHGIKSYEELLEKSQNIEWFWSEVSKEVVEWYEPPKQILEWKPPYAKWFVGSKYNITHDALDKQVKLRPHKVAYIFEGERGDIRKITYKELYDEVNKLANALKRLGLKKRRQSIDISTDDS
jgi:acetyl-CoA synthetase